MKYNVIDYITEESVKIVSIIGYNSPSDIPEQGEEVGRLIAESVNDLRSLGEDVLDAVAKFKACEATPEAIWEKFNPTPKSQAIETTQEVVTSTKPKKKKLPKAKKEPTSETAGDAGGETKEGKDMAKEKSKPKAKGKTKVAVKKAVKKVAAKKGRPKNNGEPRGDKVLLVKKLLQSAKGTTTREVLDKTGWKAVSMPAMAKHAKLKLRKEKEPGKPTRYFGS